MKKAFIVITVLIIALFAFIAYSGVFCSVSITEKEIGPFTMILKKHTGSYYKTGAVFDEVGSMLEKSIDITRLRAVGLYYDDPDKVKKEELRSECGFIVGTDDREKIGALPDGLIEKQFEKAMCAVGEFPIRTFLSYMIGPSKAYPKLAEYSTNRAIDTDLGMEIYDMQANTIQYCMPLKKGPQL